MRHLHQLHEFPVFGFFGSFKSIKFTSPSYGCENSILEQDEIYMKVPKGLPYCDENAECKLNKAKYGSKQAARCWFEVFENVRKDVVFENLILY